MNRRNLLAVLAAAVAGIFFGHSTMAADFPAGSPKFETDYKAALAAASKSGKPVIVVFSAAWCAPCQANKKKVYPSAAVKPYHEKFVWAYLDTDNEANAKVLEGFGGSGIPHIQFLSKSGKALDKMVGASSPDVFAKKLEAVLAKAK